MLPREAVDQYRALNQDCFQRQLSDLQATEEAHRLLRLARYGRQKSAE